MTCVLQAHLFGLFTCKSLLIRGWRGTDDRTRLSSPPVMQAYLRALRLSRVNSALTERHAVEQPRGTATQRRHAEDGGTLCTLTQGYWHLKIWQSSSGGVSPTRRFRVHFCLWVTPSLELFLETLISFPFYFLIFFPPKLWRKCAFNHSRFQKRVNKSQVTNFPWCILVLNE